MVFLGASSILSNLGTGTETNFDAIIEGKSALRSERFEFSKDAFCCSVLQKESTPLYHSKTKALTRLENMLAVVISDVLEKAKVVLSDKRSLLIISTTKGNIDVLENKNGRKDSEYLSSIAKILAEEFDCANIPLVVSNACISGLLAIIMAHRLIEAKQYDQVIVCGGDLVTEFTLSGFKSFNALSNEPCRPFDADRKGINLGEATAAIHLSKDKISDVVIEAGASANDANHISGPSRTGDGLYQALNETLSAYPSLKPDFINAHGTATLYNDDMESVAFERAGLATQPVNSLKGYYGHTLGTAGVLETILSIESLKQNRLIASANFENKGTAHLTSVITRAEERPLKTFLKTASGFGGCNAAALFRKL